MLTPSPEIIQLLSTFAVGMTAPTFQNALVLLYGAILAPGRRTVCAALRVMGLSEDPHFGKYHRVLSRARWSPQRMSPLLLGLLVRAFLPKEAPLVVLVDETLERLAEDGNTGPISDAFMMSGAGMMQGTILGPNIPPIAPGEMTSMRFSLDGTLPSSRYFSYASMVIPSNDAFIANGNPMAFPLFDMSGNFLSADFIVLGEMVLDAGTEVNDEIPMNTAFFGQVTPDTGTPQNGTVELHPGYLPPGSGGILDDPMFANADFKAAGYQVARISVTAVPEPGQVTLFGAALLSMGLFSLKRRTRRPTSPV